MIDDTVEKDNSLAKIGTFSDNELSYKSVLDHEFLVSHGFCDADEKQPNNLQRVFVVVETSYIISKKHGYHLRIAWYVEKMKVPIEDFFDSDSDYDEMDIDLDEETGRQYAPHGFWGEVGDEKAEQICGRETVVMWAPVFKLKRTKP